MTKTIIGYWYSKLAPQYPVPVGGHPMSNKQEFLSALHKKQSSAGCKRFKGFSHCRICGCANGSEEYVTKKFCWPSGYSHYIQAHDIEVDKEFYDFIYGKK